MPETSGKRERNKQANRAAILDAARHCFLEHGYESVTIRDVIRHTGLASGTFYNYFEDKAQVLRALLEERMGALAMRLATARRGATSVEDFLHGSYLAVFREISEHPDFYAMMFRNEPVVRVDFNDTVMGQTMKELKQDLRLAISRGLLPELDTDYLTAIFFGAGYELARMLVARKGKKPEEAAAFATRLFLQGVLGQAPKPSLVRRGPITLDGSAR